MRNAFVPLYFWLIKILATTLASLCQSETQLPCRSRK